MKKELREQLEQKQLKLQWEIYQKTTRDAVSYTDKVEKVESFVIDTDGLVISMRNKCRLKSILSTIERECRYLLSEGVVETNDLSIVEIILLVQKVFKENYSTKIPEKWPLDFIPLTWEEFWSLI